MITEIFKNERKDLIKILSKIGTGDFEIAVMGRWVNRYAQILIMSRIYRVLNVKLIFHQGGV